MHYKFFTLIKDSIILLIKLKFIKKGVVLSSKKSDPPSGSTIKNA